MTTMTERKIKESEIGNPEEFFKTLVKQVSRGADIQSAQVFGEVRSLSHASADLMRAYQQAPIRPEVLLYDYTIDTDWMPFYSLELQKKADLIASFFMPECQCVYSITCPGEHAHLHFLVSLLPALHIYPLNYSPTDSFRMWVMAVLREPVTLLT